MGLGQPASQGRGPHGGAIRTVPVVLRGHGFWLGELGFGLWRFRLAIGRGTGRRV